MHVGSSVLLLCLPILLALTLVRVRALFVLFFQLLLPSSVLVLFLTLVARRLVFVVVVLVLVVVLLVVLLLLLLLALVLVFVPVEAVSSDMRSKAPGRAMDGASRQGSGAKSAMLGSNAIHQ